MGNGKRPFSSEDDAFILANYRSGQQSKESQTPGLTVPKIAKALGRSKNSIVSRYHRLMRHKAQNTKPCYEPHLQQASNRQAPSMPKLKFLGEK